jgi:hypothetical protein
MTVSLATHEVMCLVKRHTYELAFAIPDLPHDSPEETQPHLHGRVNLHVRLKQTYDTEGFVLNLEDVERLYEDLLQMMEYLRNERQRIELSKPVA